MFCQNAGRCIISCDTRDCLSYGYIHAENAGSLEITSSAEYCLYDNEITAPDEGNVTVVIESAESNADGMTITAGSNTKSISITCVGPGVGNSNNECRLLTVCLVLTVMLPFIIIW